MDLHKFITLAGGGLWLARLDQFKTIFEGMLPRKNKLGIFSMLTEDGAKWILKQYPHARNFHVYASCWHMNDNDPPQAVWDEFDKLGNGLAVRTSYEILQTELSVTCRIGAPGEGPIFIGEVDYIDYNRDQIKDWNLLEAAFSVRKKWSFEKELRLITYTDCTPAWDLLRTKEGYFGDLVTECHKTTSPTESFELIGGHEGGKALVYRINPIRMILEVLPNPKVTTTALAEIYREAAKYGLESRVRIPS
jgi:hypothetical protein